MGEPEASPIFKIAEEMYRWKETSKLALRLSYTMEDLLRETTHFCKKNNIEIGDGMAGLIAEAGRLFQAIKETQQLPIRELMARPPTQLRPSTETLHGKKRDDSHRGLDSSDP